MVSKPKYEPPCNPLASSAAACAPPLALKSLGPPIVTASVAPPATMIFVAVQLAEFPPYSEPEVAISSRPALTVVTPV